MPWPAAWYIACRSRELKRRPRAVSLAGEHLVLFRDQVGAANALEDRCAHRGAPLSGGSVEAGALRCPYHGWLYGGDGRVREVPALGTGAQLPNEACVRAFAVVESQGYVWIRIGPTGVADAPHVFAHLAERGWSHFRMRTRFAASVPVCLENFLDCPHATFVHRGWFRAPTGRTVQAIVTTLKDGAQAEYFDEPRTGSVVWRLLAPKAGVMRHTDRFIAPNVSQVDYDFPNGLHYTITSCCTPVAEHETIVNTVISFRCRHWGPLIRTVFEPLSRLIIRQDVRMLLSQRANLARFEDRRFVSTEADLLGPHIAAWHRALREGKAPPRAGTARQVEMRL